MTDGVPARSSHSNTTISVSTISTPSLASRAIARLQFYLARELTASVNGAATVLMGQCLSYGEGITYWPVREIFEAAGAVPE